MISFLFKEMGEGDSILASVAKGVGGFSLGVPIKTWAPTFKNFIRAVSSFEVFG